MATFPSEVVTYVDPRSGRRVRQLTSHRCHSHHLYFTNPGWFDGGRRLLFASDRGNRSNLYSVHLESGEITQHTFGDMPRGAKETSFLSCALNPTRPEAYFWRGRDLMAMDLMANQERRLFEAPDGFLVNMLNVTADGRQICTALYEDLSDRFAVDLFNGYVGFREYWAARPQSRLMTIPTDGGPAREVFAEHSWIGHVNTSPTLPNILTFCHEGPWEKVDNRIWGCDLNDGRVWPIRQRRAPDEIVGHEYWHADGIHIGYHGRRDGRHTFGRIRYDDTDCFEVAFDEMTGHIHSNGFDLVVGDGQGDRDRCLRLWRFNGSGFDPPRALAMHNGSFHVQKLHVHPRFSPDGTKVVYTSDRDGYGQVYEVEVGDIGTLPLLRGA